MEELDPNGHLNRCELAITARKNGNKKPVTLLLGKRQPTLAAPTGLTASDGTKSTKIDLSWNASDGATGYHIYYNTVNDLGTSQQYMRMGLPVVVAAAPTPAAPYIFAPNPVENGWRMCKGVNYFFWIVAVGVNGVSNPSVADVGHIPGLPAPQILSAQYYPVFNNTVITVIGGDNSYVFYTYDIFRSSTPNFANAQHLSTVSGQANAQLTDHAPPGWGLYYWVRCNEYSCPRDNAAIAGPVESVLAIGSPNNINNGKPTDGIAESASAMMEEAPAVGQVPDAATKEQPALYLAPTDRAAPFLSVYPNPAKGNATVTFNSIENSDGTLELIDLQGRIVLRQEIQAAKGHNATVLDISELQPGLYVVRLRQDGGSPVQTRLVKH